MVAQNLGIRRTSNRHARGAGNVGRVDQPSTEIPCLARRNAPITKLDAVSWAGGIAFRSCGVRLGVRVDDPSILDQLQPYLPPDRELLATPEVDHLFSLRTAARPRLYEGSRLVRRARGLDIAMQLDLLRSILELQVATNAPSRTFVHAGVVEWRGRAIVIPGRSRSGKTTLVTALLRAGAKYFSDEYAVLDAAGRVHPWARPLRIRREGLLPQSYPVELFGQRAPQRSLPVGLIVVTAHRAGAVWRPRPLSPGQAVMALVRHTQVTRARPDLAIKFLSRAVRGARAVASQRGEADELAATLLSTQDGAEESNHIARIAGGNIR